MYPFIAAKIFVADDMLEFRRWCFLESSGEAMARLEVSGVLMDVIELSFVNGLSALPTRRIIKSFEGMFVV